MNISIPFIEIILFITSIIVPAEVKEFNLTVEGQKLHFQQTAEKEWSFTHKEIGTAVYTLSEGSVTTEIKEQKIESNIGEYLSLPVGKDAESVIWKNGTQMNIQKKETKIIYTLRKDESSHETFIVSWEK